MEEQKIEEKKEECPVVAASEGASKAEDVKKEAVGVAAEEPSKEKQEAEAKEEEKDEKNLGEGKEEEEKEKRTVETEEKNEGAVPSETLTETLSFKEESYSIGDLTDTEKKALEAFRQKVEEAIKTKSIFKKSKKKVEEKVVVAESPISVEPETPPAETPVSAATTETPALEETEAKDREIPATAEELVAPTAPVKDAPPDAPTDATDETTLIADKREIPIDETLVPPVEEGPKNFHIWGIPIHDGDDKTDALLLKFLRACNFKVDETLSMIKSTVKWRKEFGADGIEEVEIEGKEEFERWAFLYGVDKEGHPVCYNRNMFQSKGVSEKAQFSKFLRWRVQMMEKSIKTHLDFAPGGVQSFIQIIDLQNSPKGINGIKKFVSLLQDNYPELAAKQIVLNMSWWSFPALYRLFGLESKVVWSGPGKSTETLFKYIAPDQVPTEYGGLGRLNDTEFKDVEAPVTHLVLKAGEKQVIELPIEEVGATLVWDVSIVGGDVVYGEEFIPDTYTVIVRKPSKLPASTEPIRNSFKVDKPGKVAITIDNSASKKKKMVVYRSMIKKTASE